MKQFFFKQYIILFIALCFITSCNLTGNFGVVKRKYENGYYIKTPFFNNDNSKTTIIKKQTQLLETVHGIIPNNSENIFASTDSISLFEILKSKKTISQTNGYNKFRNTIKPVDDISNKKKSFKTPKKLLEEFSENDKKIDGFSLISFILSCTAYLLIPICFIPMSIILLSLIELFALFLPLFGIILGFIGLHRIKKNPDKYKGKIYALTAIIFGFLFYILMILIAFIEISQI